MFKLCTNKNHSYKHNEQINRQNIDNSEYFGVKLVKNRKKYGFGRLYRDFFYTWQYFWPHTVCVHE